MISFNGIDFPPKTNHALKTVIAFFSLPLTPNKKAGDESDGSISFDPGLYILLGCLLLYG
jgi:hypothetical protein